MTADLQLFRVTVTQEWSAQATAMVWAPDVTTAAALAEDAVDFDLMDADPISPFTSARLEPLDDGVLDRMDDGNLWLILADGTVCDNSRAGLEQFRSVLTADRLSALRLARIEAGNGQLALLEVA